MFYMQIFSQKFTENLILSIKCIYYEKLTKACDPHSDIYLHLLICTGNDLPAKELSCIQLELRHISNAIHVKSKH